MTKGEIQKLINKARDAAEVEWADSHTGGREAYIASGRNPIVGVWIRRTCELVIEDLAEREALAVAALKLYAEDKNYVFYDGVYWATTVHGDPHAWAAARKTLQALGVEIEPLDIARVYDSAYGDQRECECGHAYERHFDGYEDNAPVGCKYSQKCGCETFIPKLWAEPETLPGGTVIIDENPDLTSEDWKYLMRHWGAGKDG